MTKISEFFLLILGYKSPYECDVIDEIILFNFGVLEEMVQ